MRLFGHHFRSELGGVLGWGLALAVMTVMLTAVYTLVAGGLADQFQQILTAMPPQMREFFGSSAGAVTSVPAWLSAIALSGFLPMLVAIWVALAVVGVITADTESGTLEFILSLPVHRWRLLAERWLSLLSQLALLYAAVWAVMLGTVAGIGQHIDAGRLSAALGVQFLAEAALAGMLLLVSLPFRDQVKGVLSTITLALVFVFLPVFVEAGSRYEWLRKLTPFDYGGAGQLLLGGAFPWSDAWLLLAWAVVGFALALVTFIRQEV